MVTDKLRKYVLPNIPYPKGTDAPALYSWRYAGKFSARAGTPDR